MFQLQYMGYVNSRSIGRLDELSRLCPLLKSRFHLALMADIREMVQSQWQY
jgi:hypothetical protein